MSEGPAKPSDAAGAADARAVRTSPGRGPASPSRRRALLGTGLAAMTTLGLVVAVWPAAEREDVRQGPPLQTEARPRGPERAGPQRFATPAETAPNPDDTASPPVTEEEASADVPAGQLPPALRALRWGARGDRATLAARVAMAHPGRYAAYAELALSADGSQTVSVFSRTRVEVQNETDLDIFLTFRSPAFRNPNSISGDRQTIYLRKFLVKRVDHHPSTTIAEVAGLTLFAVKEAARASAKGGSKTEARPPSAPRD